jgi:predicted amidophosphoribosyltransferase
MQCPHCRRTLPTRICTRCGGDTPAEGLYCMGCGAKLEERPEEVIRDDGDFDPENRILCPDGTCTGIIINGRCIECGKPYKED